MLKHHPIDLLLVDLELPDGTGLDLLRFAKQQDQDLVVTLITGKATVQSALDAMKEGAFDYLLKPLPPKELRAHVQKALAHRALLIENRTLRKQIAKQKAYAQIVGSSSEIRATLRLIEKVAPYDSTVLITGESGTGKELVARTIHLQSPRCNQSFIAINCSALPETLLESELFGHEKGSFTGAVAHRKGVFAQSDRGTLLLDEIGTMPLKLQSQLLRVLEEKQIRPVGAEQSYKVDVRVLAATNADLGLLIRQGKFREDLFFRLNVVSIPLAPLRQRKADIAQLALYFMGHSDQPGSLKKISPEALKLLENYSWPGNVRELANVIERAGVLAEGENLTPELFPQEILRPVSHSSDFLEEEFLTLAEVEKRRILQALEATGWKRGETARLLGIDRRTLYNKIRIYRLDPDSEIPE